MTRKWLGTGLLLLLVAVLGCSSSPASAQPPAPPAVSPSWTAVVTPDGYSNEGYIATLCFNNDWVILTSAESSGHWWSLNVAYGGKC